MYCIVHGVANSQTQLSNFHFHYNHHYRTFCFGDYSNFGHPRLLSGKESACQFRRCERHGFNSEPGRYPGEGNGNPLLYSCLENSTDKRAWRVTVHEVSKKSDTTEQLSMHTAHVNFAMEYLAIALDFEHKFIPSIFKMNFLFSSKHRRNVVTE